MVCMFVPGGLSMWDLDGVTERRALPGPVAVLDGCLEGNWGI